MCKKLICLFLMLILFVQILPLKQLGLALTKSYFTEEINNNSEEAAKKITNDTEDFTAILKHHTSLTHLYPSIIYNSNLLNSHYREAIPNKREISVITPPPNFFITS